MHIVAAKQGKCISLMDARFYNDHHCFNSYTIFPELMQDAHTFQHYFIVSQH